MSVETKAEPAGDDEIVPKLPRGRGMRFSRPELLRIALTLVTLIGVIMLAGPCAKGVSSFVMGLDEGSGSATAQPGVQPQYEQLEPGMTEAELKAAIERAKARNAGSGSAPSSP